MKTPSVPVRIVSRLPALILIYGGAIAAAMIMTADIHRLWIILAAIPIGIGIDAAERVARREEADRWCSAILLALSEDREIVVTNRKERVDG